jgi:hypothetical protein
MKSYIYVVLLLFFQSANFSSAQDQSIQFSIINSAGYSIGVGSCGRPCKVYKKMNPMEEGLIKIPTGHSQIYIERNIYGADPVAYQIDEKLINLPKDHMLVFVPNFGMVIISRGDLSSIDFRNPKSINEYSKGRLQVLD